MRNYILEHDLSNSEIQDVFVVRKQPWVEWFIYKIQSVPQKILDTTKVYLIESFPPHCMFFPPKAVRWRKWNYVLQFFHCSEIDFKSSSSNYMLSSILQTFQSQKEFLEKSNKCSIVCHTITYIIFLHSCKDFYQRLRYMRLNKFNQIKKYP